MLEAQVEGSTSGDWTLYSVAMPAAPAEVSVKLEFSLNTDSSGGAPDTYELGGWYIDDFVVKEQ